MPPLSSFLRVADLALPPRCPGCGAIVREDHRFCAECWQGFRFLGPPWCAQCNLPFEYDRGPGARCAPCLEASPPHDGVRAAVAYGDVARSVVLKLKYGGRMAYAETMARAMARLLPEDADLLVPVPLHRWRLWSRGYNQALLLAQGLGRRSGVRVDADVLRRTRATAQLRGMGPRERAKTVTGAFSLVPDARNRLAGKTVVLVDDVHTSGATGNACARILKRGGAARVILLAFARVLEDEPGD